MGYSTEFIGELKFKKEVTTKELAKIKSFFDLDFRDIPEIKTEVSYIDLEFCDDFSGLKWNGGEKTYEMVGQINLILSEMQKDFPEFKLEGEFMAQGEDIEDRWKLVFENDIAVEKKIEIKGKKVLCPHCEEYHFIEYED